ncbi:hypothetical protein CG471_21770 [Sphingobium sp. IP1]|uniref:phage protease n=1 Tax=Sphingobium sp. IP1 TaxID=2021637 RepID=UPI000C08C932|nr:phage protease [Sphingobium sp. IP1]PHP17653.1 hypothetical protein CG471_21770 [Sphingobium sp. IP1]
MSKAIALCAAQPVVSKGAVAPDWLHLLPIGEIKSRDGRGPYHLRDAAKVIAASLAQAKGKLVLDENHATDLSAPKGGEAPARGWIVDLQARADGIWGRVEWTDAAISRGIWTEYRGVSPVILHQKNGTIDAVLRASLVNQPNFVGLTSLHMASRPAAVQAPLNAADHAVIALMGIDEDAYRKQSASAGTAVSVGSLAALNTADRGVIALMGLDPDHFLKTRAADLISSL